MTYKQILKQLNKGTKISRTNLLWNENGVIIYKRKDQIYLNDFYMNEIKFEFSEEDMNFSDYYIVNEKDYNLQMSQFRLAELEYGCCVSVGSNLYFNRQLSRPVEEDAWTL